MRRKDRATSHDEALELLKNAEYGVLSIASQKGTPYGVPLNYCVIDNGIYFHCASEGRKIDFIAENNTASFCAVGKTVLLPAQFGTTYESVIVSGPIEEVFDTAKQTGLEGLLLKYSPDYMEKGKKYINGAKKNTRVFKITIENLTGKAKK